MMNSKMGSIWCVCVGGGGYKSPGGWVGLVGVGPVDAMAASLARPFFTTSTADVPHLPGVMVDNGCQIPC